MTYWSPAEDQVLHDLYASKGTKACQAVLGRSPASIRHRACNIGVVRHGRWTEKEKERLRMDWGSVAFSEICKNHGRPKEGVYCMAIRLGLTAEIPQGFELISHAATRVGYALKTLQNMLEAIGARPRPTTTRPRRSRKGRRHYIIDSMDVDEAVEAWMQSEPLLTAAKRYGIADNTAKRWLLEAGVPAPPEEKKGCHWRVPTEVLERVIGGRIKDPRENTVQAARRIGVTQPTLRTWLVDAGVELPVRHAKLDPAVVDRVVAERRKRTTCRSKAK
jgi:transposase-like protein